MEEITPDNFIVIKNAEGFVVSDAQGNVLLQRKSDGEIFHADFGAVGETFGLIETTDPGLDNLYGVVEGNCELYNSREKESCSGEKESRNPWSKSEIIQLIELYKTHNKYFKSTTIKNDRVWSMIGSAIEHHTTDQCKNKFKYLEQKYVEKKDNMGKKSSGAASIKFEYFDELDSIFGTDANVIPVATASSSRGIGNIDIDIEGTSSDRDINSPVSCSTSEGSHPAKKRKLSQLESKLHSFEDKLEHREKARNKRHQEMMEKMLKSPIFLRMLQIHSPK